MRRPIYLDHHATTPCDPRVVEAMIPYFTERFGNPVSRSHRFGWEAEDAVNFAREEVAGLIGCRAKEIFFTGGATESNNLALKGLLEERGYAGAHVVTCVTEHAAVLDPLAWAEGLGTEVTCLPVDGKGRIDPDEVRRAAQTHGGGQEGRIRSGTLNVPGAVGLGRACALAADAMPDESRRTAALRDRLWEKVRSGIDQVTRNGDPEQTLPNSLSLTFRYVEGEALLMDMEDVAFSPASACSSGSARPSHVLLALGLDVGEAQSTVRFGLGRFTTEEEIDFTAERLIETVRRLRSCSPLYEEERRKGEKE